MAQSAPDDVLWAVDAFGAGVAIDPFGQVVATATFPSTGTEPRPIWRAPDGALWFYDPPARSVAIRNADLTPRASVPVPFPVAEIVFDPSGDAWMVDTLVRSNTSAASDLWRVAPDGTVRARRSVLAEPTAITIDATGGVVVTQRNLGGGVVSRVDSVTGAVRVTTLPADVVMPLAIAATPQDRLLVGSLGALLELDANLTVRRSIRDPNLRVRQIVLRDRATALISGEIDELFELDLSSFTIERASDRLRPLNLSVDSRGAVWSIRSDARVVRLTPDLRRAELVATGSRNWAFDRGLLARALVVAPLADDDGDGTANGVEVDLGTNYLDPQSRPEAALRLDRVRYRQDDRIDFELRGVGTGAALFFAGGYDLGLPPIPGIAGRPRLPAQSLAPFAIAAPAVGTVSLVVPDDRALSGIDLFAQALMGIVQPRFTNHVGLVLERAVDNTVRESFGPTSALRTDASSATIVGGQLVPLPVGGAGRLGVFDHADGRDLGNGVFEWRTDDQFVPAARTLFGADVRVRDGRFDFQRFEIPAGITVRFVGSRPLQLSVAGLCRIDGTLDLSGATVARGHQGNNSRLGPPVVPGPGQSGSAGGAGAGRGGDGAFGCDGTGNPQQPQFNDFAGFDGEDVQLPADHAYAGQQFRTGGRGGALFPPHGDQARLVYRGFGGQYGVEAGGSGSGGGFRGRGADGEVREAGYIQGDPPNLAERGPPTPGGNALPTLLPIPTGVSSLDHFLVGGSGGGGGGSHALFAQVSNAVDPLKFHSGAGGAGGGGALALRVGRELNVTGTGRIVCRGGNCEPTATSFTVLTNGALAPGGGGSGGSALVQVAGTIQQAGVVDVRGGAGALTDVNGFFNFDIRGGDGAPGYARLETPGSAPPLTAFGSVEPPANAADVGVLRDRDPRAMAVLGRLDPQLGFGPEFRYYELDATIDGQTVRFTDDPTRFAPADQSGQPIRIRFRSAPDGAAPGPWRDYVTPTRANSIAGEANEGFEVLIDFDTSVVRDVRVDELRVVVRD